MQFGPFMMTICYFYNLKKIKEGRKKGRKEGGKGAERMGEREEEVRHSPENWIPLTSRLRVTVGSRRRVCFTKKQIWSLNP